MAFSCILASTDVIINSSPRSLSTCVSARLNGKRGCTLVADLLAFDRQRSRTPRLSKMHSTAAVSLPSSVYAPPSTAASLPELMASRQVLLQSPSAPKKALINRHALLHTAATPVNDETVPNRMKTVYLFHVKNEQGAKATWFVDMKKKGRVLRIDDNTKPPLKPDVRIEVSDRDLVGLATGTVSAFFSGSSRSVVV